MKINWIITATIGLASQKTITAIYVKQSTNFKNSKLIYLNGGKSPT